MIEQVENDNVEDGQSTAVLSKLDEFEEELAEIKTQLEHVKRGQQGEDSSTEALAQEVFDTLPTAPKANATEVAAAGQSADQLDTQFAYTALEDSGPTTAEALARQLGADKSENRPVSHEFATSVRNH